MMRTVEVFTIDELIKVLHGFANHYAYRGHANAAWNLASSLERAVGEQWSFDSAKRYEEFSLDHFKAKFHLYDRENITPDSKLAWLAIMQHYGVPTRLVDFTVSPYVALYFALEAYDYQSKCDIAIFAIDHRALMEVSLAYVKTKDGEFKETRHTLHTKQDIVFDEMVDRFSYEIAWVTEPKHHNQRLDRQGGCFLLSGDRGTKLMDVLANPRYAECDFVKIVIHHSLCSAVFALLRVTNVTSTSLYGDLDGLARTIRMQMQVYSAPDQVD